jgi:hypothetical protein
MGRALTIIKDGNSARELLFSAYREGLKTGTLSFTVG